MLPNARVELADGERYIRKYEAVRAGGHSGGQGTLYVTSARLIFYAKAKGKGTQRESTVVQQTRMQDITGIAAYVSYRISLGLMIVTVVFGLGLVAALATKVLIWIVIDAIVVVLCAMKLASGSSKHGSAGVIINSKSSEASPIGFGNFNAQRSGLFSLLGSFARIFRAYTAFDVMLGVPGEDSDKIIEQLGAAILDIQQRGDAALKRWGVGDIEGVAGLGNGAFSGADGLAADDLAVEPVRGVGFD
jgi:uncharacterized membrane protein (GlpM family)